MMSTTPDPSPAPSSFPSPPVSLETSFSVIYASSTATLPRPSRSIFSECVSSLRCQAQPKQTTHDVFRYPNTLFCFSFSLPTPFLDVSMLRDGLTRRFKHTRATLVRSIHALSSPHSVASNITKRLRSGVVPVLGVYFPGSKYWSFDAIFK